MHDEIKDKFIRIELPTFNCCIYGKIIDIDDSIIEFILIKDTDEKVHRKLDIGDIYHIRKDRTDYKVISENEMIAYMI